MWKPVIKDNALKEAISEKLKEIYVSVKSIDEPSCSLLAGQPGIVLLKSYYFRSDPTQAMDYDWNVQLLFNYFENPQSLNYSMGIAGILRTLQHLEKEEFFDFGDTLKTFDYSIFNDYILNEPTLDYLHGSSGVILSLIEQDSITRPEAFMRNWFSAIEKTREASNDELKWKIDFKYAGTIQQGYCMGLAHGFPSIVLILLKLYKKNPSAEVLLYIKQGLNFILNTKNDDSSEYYFPSRIINSVKAKGRLAWCYGDLTIAWMLYEYARCFDDKTMNDLAIEILKKHSVKHDFKFYDVDDADFCHGSVGIAHVYARMYNHTNIEVFRKTSEYWYRITLEKAHYRDGLAGYKHSTGMNQELVNEYGLLEGVSGIGLSFISAISPVEPKWDSCLLLS